MSRNVPATRRCVSSRWIYSQSVELSSPIIDVSRNHGERTRLETRISYRRQNLRPCSPDPNAHFYLPSSMSSSMPCIMHNAPRRRHGLSLSSNANRWPNWEGRKIVASGGCYRRKNGERKPLEPWQRARCSEINLNDSEMSSWKNNDEVQKKN